MEEADLPPRPSKKRFDNTAILKGIRSIHKNPGDISIETTSEKVIVKIDFGDLQPGRCICSETFYIGSKISQEILLSIFAYADNLSIPTESTLTVSVSSKKKSIAFEQLKLMDNRFF